MYTQGYQCLKSNDDQSIKKQFEGVMNIVLESSLYSQTQGKVQLIVKHAPEGSFSPGDLGKFIDRVYVEYGVKVKLVVADYLEAETYLTDSKLLDAGYTETHNNYINLPSNK